MVVAQKNMNKTDICNIIGSVSYANQASHGNYGNSNQNLWMGIRWPRAKWAHFALKRPPALCLFRKSPPAPSASHYFFSQAPEPLYPIPPPLEIDLGGRLRSSRSLRSTAPPPIQPSRISGSRRWPFWRPSSRVVVLDGGGPRPGR